METDMDEKFSISDCSNSELFRQRKKTLMLISFLIRYRNQLKWSITIPIRYRNKRLLLRPDFLHRYRSRKGPMSGCRILATYFPCRVPTNHKYSSWYENVRIYILSWYCFCGSQMALLALILAFSPAFLHTEHHLADNCDNNISQSTQVLFTFPRKICCTIWCFLIYKNNVSTRHSQLWRTENENRLNNMNERSF